MSSYKLAIKLKIRLSELLVGIAIFIMVLVSFTVILRDSLYGGYSRFAMLLIFLILVSIVIFLQYNSHSISILQVMWMLVFLITLRNNANLNSGSTASTLYCCIAFFVPTLIYKMKFEKRMIKWILVFAMMHAIIGLFFMLFPELLISNLDKLFPTMIPSQKSFLISTINNRYLVGITGHYSTSGMYMVAGFIASSALLFYRAIVKNTGIVKMNRELFLIVFFCICLILTGKRAHLLFGVLSFCANYILIYNRGSYKVKVQRILKFAFAFIFILLVALNIPAFQATFNRFMSEEMIEEMRIGRVDSKWIPAFELFMENPLFGCGWLQFGRLHPTYNSGDEIYRNVHNIYIQLLCETGLVGSAFIIGIMVLTLFMTLRRIVELNKEREYSQKFLFLIFSFSYQFFFLLYGITGNPLYDIQTLFPYMLCCGITYKYCTKRFLKIGRSKSGIRENIDEQFY